MNFNKSECTVSLSKLFAIFLASSVIFLVAMSRRPVVYDEGLIVTDAMRVSAGQIPHRDFYANYGPAQFYLLAGLFKFFGQSLFVERVYDLVAKSTLATVIFYAASFLRRRWLTYGVYVVSILWIFVVGTYFGSPIPEVCLLNVAVALLLLPEISNRTSNRRLVFAGALTGLCVFFRYDIGVALAGIGVLVLAVAAVIADEPFRNRIRSLARSLGFYLLGTAAIVVPPLLYFVSVAPFSAFIHDLVIYPSKYYYRARSLPFPAVDIVHFSNLAIYMAPLIALLSILVSVTTVGQGRLHWSSVAASLRNDRRKAFLFVFGLLGLVMFFKGYVRISTIHMFLSIIPSVLLLAVLFEYSTRLPKAFRVCSIALLVICAVSAANASLLEARQLIRKHVWMFPSPALDPIEQTWCHERNELTTEICFLPDDDRIQTITFLKTHTTPAQKLFVANTRNDIVYMNDNMMYFAAGRLPATHWSHFDPDLQNTVPIQSEMIHELDVYQPPYIVIDAEFGLSREPNDSSRSTGVTLLDQYIRRKYIKTVQYGRFSILRRIDD